MTPERRNPENIDQHDPQSGRRLVQVLMLGAGILILAGLFGGGLWLTGRFARTFAADKTQRQTNLQRSLARAIRDGMSEASSDGDEDMRSSLPEASQSAPTHAIWQTSAWSAAVNDFIVREILGGDVTRDRDESAQLNDVLDRAVHTLDLAESQHPAVEGAIRTLIAASYLHRRQFDHCADQSQRALDVLNLHFGEAHPYTVRAMENLGIARLRQARIGDTIEIYRRLADLRVLQSGPEHPDTIQTMQFLRVLLQNQDAPELITPDMPRVLHPSIEMWILLEYDCCSFRPLEF